MALDECVSVGRLICGEHQWNPFCQFMSLYDVKEKPEVLQAKDPCVRLHPFLLSYGRSASIAG